MIAVETLVMLRGRQPPREPDPRLPFRHSYASVDPKTVRLFAPGRSWGMTRAGAR